MPFCENCGNKVSDTAKFCSNCGEKVNSNLPTSEIQPEEPQWSLEKFLEENPPNEKGIITCPRCLGKGEIDNDDIKRLSMKLFLEPGDCTYCEGVGLVNIKKTTNNSITGDLGLTDTQIKSLETLAEVIENRNGKYCFYDNYNFDRYFVHLTKDYNLYLKDSIPKGKLNAFCSIHQHNSGEKLSFDNSSEITPYVYFEDPKSNNGENGLLIAVLDNSGDWFDNGNNKLIINNNNISLYLDILDIDKIEQDNSKLEIDYYDSGMKKNIQLKFDQCAPVLSALISFFNDNKKGNEVDDKVEYDFKKIFEHLVGNQKVYLAENIPAKKLSAFKEMIRSSFEEETFIDNCTFNVYFDDSIWGKGDSGFLIATDSDGDLMLYLASLKGNVSWIPFNEILEIKIVNNVLMIRFKEDTWSLNFSADKSVLQSLINFYDYYFKSDLYDDEDDEDEDEDNDEDQDESPIKQKDGAGIR